MENPILLSSLSIRNLLESDQLNIFQFADFAKDHGFHGVEIIDRHLKSLVSNDIQKIQASIEKNKCHFTLALSNDFTLDDKDALQKQIDYVKKMIVIASDLNAIAVRVFLGGNDFWMQKVLKNVLSRKKDENALETIKRQKSFVYSMLGNKLIRHAHVRIIKNRKPKQMMNQAVEERIHRAFDQILPVAEEYRINLAIENHWGVSTISENILDIIHHYQSMNLGTCPDFDNFSIHQNRYEELAKLLPYAKEIHVKSFKFDETGEEKTIDFRRCFAEIHKSGYRGPFVIEYEGEGDQIQDSLKTRDLVLKYDY